LQLIFFSENIQKHLGFEFTECQKTATESLYTFIKHTDNRAVFILTGYAGTGKTSMISSFIKYLSEIKINTILMAPTGRAAKVFSAYAKKESFTIHKQIYRQKKQTDINSGFSLNFNKHKNTIFIVDEASMITNTNLPENIFGSGRLLSDLIEFVFSNSNNKLILIGDNAQLPPVHLDISPALDNEVLSLLNCEVSSANMQTVVRQAEHSGILVNATIIREQLKSENYVFPNIVTTNFSDIEPITGNELLEAIENSYNKFGIEETRIITKSNKLANLYNNGIRNRILWKEEELSYGDIMMVVKNNYAWLPEKSPISFIANGDMVEITQIGKFYERYGYRYAGVNIRFIDYPEFEIQTKVLIDSLNYEGPSMPSEYYHNIMEQLRIDYSHISNEKSRNEAIINDPFYNALQIKYAYAVTCHKAQGGQWKNVFIDHGYLTEQHIDKSFLRWLYTAFTRATNKLYLINFHKEFFLSDTNN
jgi:exodeoxyribonuclease V